MRCHFEVSRNPSILKRERGESIKKGKTQGESTSKHNRWPYSPVKKWDTQGESQTNNRWLYSSVKKRETEGEQ